MRPTRFKVGFFFPRVKKFALPNCFFFFLQCASARYIQEWIQISAGQNALTITSIGSYFTAVDLAEIGQTLDQQEQAVGGLKRGGESQNYDDSGYFSIQVLQKALEIWNLELVPWGSKEMEEARKEPT